MATRAGTSAWRRRRRAVAVVGVVAASVLTGCLHTERVSVSSSGAEANGPSRAAGISGDGRFVAFTSTASNLVAGDTNGVADLFLRDNVTAAVVRVSLEADGSQLDGAGVTQGGVSSDGRYATFTTTEAATATDTDARADVFVRDRQAGTTVLASVPPPGLPDAAAQGTPSRNGRHVVVSLAGGGIYVRHLASATSGHVTDWSAIGAARVSDDGGVVAFVTMDPVLADDANSAFDVYVFDDGAGTVERLPRAIASLGTFLRYGYDTLAIDLTADGRSIAYTPVREDTETPSMTRALVYDRVAGTSDELPGSSASQGHEALPQLSAGGRFAAYLRNRESYYITTPAELVVVDRLLRTTTVVEVFPSPAAMPFVLSGDGRWTAFTASTAEVAGDENGVDDVVLRYGHAPVVSSVEPAAVGAGSRQLTIDVAGVVGVPEVEVAGGGVTVTGVTASPGALHVTVDVAPGAAAGPRDVLVRAPGGWPGRAVVGASTICRGCLTVTS